MKNQDYDGYFGTHCKPDGKIMKDFDFDISLNDIGSADTADPISSFINAMADKGFVCNGLTAPTGDTVHRFNRKGNGGEKNCYAVLFNDGVFAGGYGDFATGEYHKWCAVNRDTLDFLTILKIDKRIEQAKIQREQHHEDKKKIMTKVATSKIENLNPAKNDHPYLTRKKIKSYGLLQDGELLYIPAYNQDGQIQTHQTIDPTGKKRFLKGASKKGSFYPIGETTNTVYLCEGYATGATVHHITGKQVFVAFDSGNMIHVAAYLKIKGKIVTVIADNDQWKETNTGIETAKEIKKKYGFSYILPVFDDLGLSLPTDFNDIGATAPAELKTQLLNNSHKLLSLLRETADYLNVTPPEPEQIITGFFGKGDKVQIVAPSKARKSFFAVQLGLCLATGTDFLGLKVPKRRKVLAVQYEIKEDYFHGRCYVSGKSMGIGPGYLRGWHQTINARGHDIDISDIAELIQHEKPDVVIFDPLYKMMDGGENAVEDMRPILKQFDALCEHLNVTIIIVHHDTKGDPSQRSIIDRGAGSGVLARDYDAKITITPQDDYGPYTIEMSCRNYDPQIAPLDSFVAEWEDGIYIRTDDPVPNMSTKDRPKKLSLDDKIDSIMISFESMNTNGLMPYPMFKELMKSCHIGMNGYSDMVSILEEKELLFKSLKTPPENGKQGKYRVGYQKEIEALDAEIMKYNASPKDKKQGTFEYFDRLL